MPPFLSCFGAVKPYFPFSVSSPSVDLGLHLVCCGFFNLLFLFHQCLLPSKPVFRPDILPFLSSSIRTKSSGLRQDNLGPPLVQISATTLLFVSFLFVTVAARHLVRSTCLRFPPPPSRRWANYPTTFTFIGVLGSLFAPLLFRLEAVKPPVPFYPSLLAIWISTSPFHSILSHLLSLTASRPRLRPTKLCRQ